MGERILVVDDDPFIRSALTELLEDEGYQAISADSGVTALEIARSQRPDVILLDVMLPGMNGIAVARQLRADPCSRDWCIIMMSAGANLLAAAREVRLDGVIAKPFDFDAVLAEIATCLHRTER